MSQLYVPNTTLIHARAPADHTLSQPALVKLKEDLKDVFPESGFFQYWEYSLGHQGLQSPASGTEDEYIMIKALILFNKDKALQFSTMHV